MIVTDLFKKLKAAGQLSDAGFERIKETEARSLFSLHWEIKTIMYVGVLLLSSGLCMLVYKNIDTIGHQAIITFITLLSTSCFYYCYQNKLPYAHGKIASPNTVFDFLLLLACLTFLSLIAYLQYQYQVFGIRYGLASFLSTVVLLFTAYYFDHLGILAMAITSFAAWMGITVTPFRLIASNDFDNSRIIFTGIAVGVLLLVAGWATKQKKVKAHFEFTYNNFGTHVLFVSLLAALFHFNSSYLLWMVLLFAFAGYSYLKAIREHSFYFFLVTVLYAYTGLSYVVIRLLLFNKFELTGMYITLFYFILSGYWLTLFLVKTNNKLRASHDSL